MELGKAGSCITVTTNKLSLIKGSGACCRRFRAKGKAEIEGIVISTLT